MRVLDHFSGVFLVFLEKKENKAKKIFFPKSLHLKPFFPRLPLF